MVPEPGGVLLAVTVAELFTDIFVLVLVSAKTGVPFPIVINVLVTA
jgi:hypothetical protein